MSKLYKIKYQDKSIFFNGDLDYLFNACHDNKTELILNKGNDNINLANFISEDKENIKKKRGRPNENLTLNIYRELQEVDHQKTNLLQHI